MAIGLPPWFCVSGLLLAAEGNGCFDPLTVPSNPIGLEMMSTLSSVISAWNVKVAVQRIFDKPDLVATNLPTNAWNR